MSHDPRRAARLAVLAALVLSLPAFAIEAIVPRVGLGSGLGSVSAPAAFVGASLSLQAVVAAPALSAALAPAPSLSAAPFAPAAASAAPALAAVSAAAAPLAPSALAAAPRSAAAPALDELRLAAASGAGSAARFDGGRAAPAAPALVRNDEGVFIAGRAAVTYREIKRLVALLQSRMSLKESLDVMDGTIAEVRAKLLSIEAIAKDRKVNDANTHLEETLTWVDGILEDGGRRIAVHTVQVYFHPAPAGPLKAASEIGEGNRRIDAYLEQAALHFAPGGEAEAALGALDEVVLSFDTRGYKEIKDHIREKEAAFRAQFGSRIRFAYVDELAPAEGSTAQVRADYNRLVEKHKGDVQGLQKIMEGVMYSRYVGILLELKTLEYYDQRQYTVLQSGRDMFGPDGKYITELDAVVRSPQGKLLLVEAKSARVGLPVEEVLRDKILYKLDTYKKNQGVIEKMIGGPLNVVFSFDVGGRSVAAAKRGVLVWQDARQKQLLEYLKAQEPALGARYGFPVSFLFLNSHPGEDPMLFYQVPGEDPHGADRDGRRRR